MRKSGQRAESFHPSSRVVVWHCLVDEISSLIRMWFLGAVLIALSFLAKGAWLASSGVKYLHCPPSSSGELLQVWSLIIFILEKLLHLARVGIWRRRGVVESQGSRRSLSKVPWNNFKLKLYAVRSWDLWSKRLVGTNVLFLQLLCYS